MFVMFAIHWTTHYGLADTCVHACILLPPFSGGPSAQAMSASLVLSSQISGYDGREFNVDSNESVELTFPIKVEQAGAYMCNFYDDYN